jgi:hypothetical protein
VGEKIYLYLVATGTPKNHPPAKIYFLLSKAGHFSIKRKRIAYSGLWYDRQKTVFFKVRRCSADSRCGRDGYRCKKIR